MLFEYSWLLKYGEQGENGLAIFTLLMVSCHYQKCVSVQCLQCNNVRGAFRQSQVSSLPHPYSFVKDARKSIWSNIIKSPQLNLLEITNSVVFTENTFTKQYFAWFLLCSWVLHFWILMANVTPACCIELQIFPRGWMSGCLVLCWKLPFSQNCKGEWRYVD